MIRAALVAAALAAASPAAGGQCPYGQLYRVRLHECVRLGSPLALAYVGRVSHRRLRVTLPPVIAPPALPRTLTDAERLDAAASLAPPTDVWPPVVWPSQ
jgi:hypothetical protein